MKLVLDAGGTSIKYGVSDNQGDFIFMRSVPTPREHLKEFLDLTGSIFDEAYAEYGIDGVALSLPGEVHSREGVIRGISAVEYLHEIPLGRILEERFGNCRVTMANDANCAAWGEMWKGVARQYKNVVFVICGTGIGGAVIEHGVLDKGTTMNKGEFGNFTAGEMKDGILQTWSDYTLEKQARKYRKTANAQGKACAAIGGKELAELAAQGDQLANRFMEEFYHWMAVGCITLEFAFDPELIAIGGGISGNPTIIQGIQDKVQRLLEGQRPGYLIPRIEACTRGSQANLYGALYYHLCGDQIEKG